MSSKNKHHQETAHEEAATVEGNPAVPAARQVAAAVKNETLNAYLGQKVRIRVEGATVADYTLAGADALTVAGKDADGRLRFFPWSQVREVFPNQP
jgi:hypothetical protein